MRPPFIVCIPILIISLMTTDSHAQLYMTEERDGTAVIQDKRPDVLDARPETIRMQEEAARRAANAQGNATVLTNEDTEPHPLATMRDENDQPLVQPRITTPPTSPFLYQLWEQDPGFRQQWENLTLEERTLMDSQAPTTKHMEFLTMAMRYSMLLMILSLVTYVMWAWFLAKICAPLHVGSFVEFLVPFWNFYLLAKAANLSPWSLLLYFVPLINFIYFFHTMGKIAERLGKSYAAWGLVLTIASMFVTVLIGLLPFYLLAIHATRTQQPGIPEEFRPVV